MKDWPAVLYPSGLGLILIVGLWVFYWGLKLLTNWGLSHLPASPPVLKFASRIGTIVRWTLILAAFILVFYGFFDLPWTPSMEEVRRVIDQPLLVQGNTRITFLSLIGLIPLFLLATWMGDTARALAEQRLLKNLKVGGNNKFGIVSLIRFGVTGLMILIGLNILGLDLSSLGLMLGVLGVGLGFGLQSTVADATAGLVILFSHPFRERDFLMMDGATVGQVIRIKLLYTEIRNLAQEVIIFPNSKILSGPVHNLTLSVDHISCKILVSVAYGSDLPPILELLIDIGRRNPYREPDMEPAAFVTSLGDSGINLALYFRILSAPDKLIAQSWSYLEISRLFKQKGINIPFPQVDVRLHQGEQIPVPRG